MVAERLVHNQHRAHVVHHEADLVGAAARLREDLVGSGHRGRQAQHHRVVEHRAVLHWRRRDSKRVSREQKM